MSQCASKALVIACAIASLVLMGCMTHPAAHAFRQDYRCKSKIQVADQGRSLFRATGCGQSATYECRYQRCWSALPEPASSRRMSASTSAPAAQPVAKKKHADGYEVFTTELYPQSNGFEVVAGAAPARAKDYILLKFHIASQKFANGEPDPCDVRLLVDLERVALEEPVRKDTQYQRVWELKLPVETGVALVRSKHAVWRVCGGTWEMKDDARERLAGLLAKHRQAVAWDEAPRAIGKVAKAPEGGWPAWSKALDAVPPASKATTFDGVQLYEQLKGSVYAVHVDAGQAKALGSAVAISKTTLLTNCHVVEGAKTVTVGSAGSELRAKIAKADPKTDRCLLEVIGGEVKPIAGVRSQKDLKVGERAFTIGSPAGFESTLGEGLVSGLREEEGLHYVQTSAPISPGSSGGGLFDQYGNLIGITTLVYVGAERLNQSLNFAIAADEFFND